MAAHAEALMGTLVTIEAAGVNETTIDRAFDWFREVEQVCTRFDPNSELSRLTTRTGAPVPVSRLLFEAVQFALHIADVSDGAFDPTIGAAMHRLGFNREHRTGAVISPPVAAEMSDLPSYRDILVDPTTQTITTRRPLLLDLGAVAKGLAVDLAARELRSSPSFAIDAGGDLYLGGHNAEGEPWSIGIRHPQQPGTCITSVRVSDQAVCTSGNYESRIADASDVAHDAPHIIDPRTNRPADDVASVTVIAPSAMLADALATATFVLGPQRGLAFLERMNVEGLVVTSELTLLQTDGWPCGG